MFSLWPFFLSFSLSLSINLSLLFLYFLSFSSLISFLFLLLFPFFIPFAFAFCTCSFIRTFYFFLFLFFCLIQFFSLSLTFTFFHIFPLTCSVFFSTLAFILTLLFLQIFHFLSLTFSLLSFNLTFLSSLVFFFLSFFSQAPPHTHTRLTRSCFCSPGSHRTRHICPGDELWVSSAPWEAERGTGSTWHSRSVCFISHLSFLSSSSSCSPSMRWFSSWGYCRSGAEGFHTGSATLRGPRGNWHRVLFHTVNQNFYHSHMKPFTHQGLRASEPLITYKSTNRWRIMTDVNKTGVFTKMSQGIKKIFLEEVL